MKEMAMRNKLIAVLLVLMMLLTKSAFADSENALHRYLNIPYETATPEMISSILLTEKNTTFELSPTGVLSGSANGLNEFGYSFDFRLDFDKNFFGCYRIRLTSDQPSQISKEECANRIPADLLQFIDMEAQLSNLYGVPDIRYFMSSRMNENEKYIRYMFADEKWTLANMQHVCKTDLRLKAYSVWDNVVLEINIDLTETYNSGVFYSYIQLYYYSDVEYINFMKKTVTETYPCP